MKKLKQKLKHSPAGNQLPVKVSRADFNRYIAPHLAAGKRGPKPKISTYKIFNYILYVLHTGIQWERLKPYRGEISWQTVYRRHNYWSKNGSYENLLLHSVKELKGRGKLNLSILHGDGSNTVAKKGANK